MRLIRKTSAVDEVFQVIQKRIVNGELAVGHRFPPQEVMAEQMGVSRSTIREAINKLTTLGFLAAKPGVGTMVVGDGPDNLVSALGQHIFISSAEVPQFVEARLYLEKAAVRLAVLKAGDEELKRLEDLLPRQKEVCRKGNTELFSELDSQFHRAIIESSHNQMLMRFLGLIWDGLSQFISEVNRLQSAAENALHFHQLLVKYLLARDLAGVERTLVEHLQDVALNIERNIGKDIGLKAMFRQEMEYSLPEISGKLAGC
ncbi:MAG: FadR family transcriptional regulator [Candidatus Adiutrix sp.]|jgi:GntR family transcriptional repressor for pyruvate dehydrogenase complex|nr:FadR family transcriptional regulator [Candidatus Adiutrix sp.]